MTRNQRMEGRWWTTASTLVPAAVLWLALAGLAMPAAAAADAANWMGAVSGKKRVSELSIPGTHDSGALHEPLTGTTQCQTLGIAQQLAIGVRFLDIRCRSVHNAFAIYHGRVDQQLTFDSVLAGCLGFLKAHGTETIIMSVKKEGEDVQSTKSFEELFDAYTAQAPEQWWLNATIPSLEDARGKIILLQRFSAAKLPKGIAAAPEDWKDNQDFHIQGAAEIQVQDKYKLANQQDKWPEVLAQLQAAALGKPDTLYLNFTSGYRPRPVLGIPDIREISNVVNPAVSRYFDQAGPGRYGIIIMDFADASRCAKIIATNQ